MLQIGLSIQILGFQIANSLIIRRAEQDDVSRKILVLEDFDNIPYFKIFPCFLLKCICLFIGNKYLVIVLFRVTNFSFIVFKCIFYHANEYDKTKR